MTLQNTNLVANVNSFDLASEDFAIAIQFEVDTKSDGSGMRSEMSKQRGYVVLSFSISIKFYENFLYHVNL